MDMEREMEDKTMKLRGGGRRRRIRRRGMILKLGERGGPSTPSITWLSTSKTTVSVSARKLCATLWEIHPHQLTPKLPSKPLQLRKKKKKKKEILYDPPEQVVVPLNCIGSPAIEGRDGNSNCNLKTSSELRKVLGRISSLEEKQSCNISSLKSLKTQLNQSHSQIKDLLKEKQSNRHEMNSLTLQVAEDQVKKKIPEQDKVKGLIQSTRADLEDERKLRKNSESLHRKLTREISQVKSAFSSALKELERERKARKLLEILCDEFAKGIRDYEQEVRSLRNKPDLDLVDREKSNRLILHISEAWLDERMQTGLEEKLSPDIENFLEARHLSGSRENRSFLNEAIKNFSRRESFPLSAPDGEDSIESDSLCFELNKSGSKKLSSGRRQNKLAGLDSRLILKEKVLDKLNIKESVSSEGDKVHPIDMNEDSHAHQASLKKEMKSKLASLEINESESPLKLPSGVKENTLQAKLLEARLEGRKYRSTASDRSKIH